MLASPLPDRMYSSSSNSHMLCAPLIMNEKETANTLQFLQISGMNTSVYPNEEYYQLRKK